MKTMFKSMLAACAALTIGLMAAAPASAVDFGWSPVVGTEAFHGIFVSQGAAPGFTLGTLAAGTGPNVVITGTGGCGTLATPKGGATVGQVTIGTFSVSCTLTLTFPVAAPNGWRCQFNDLTTPANSVPQATSSTTTCVTTAATMVTGDTIQFMAVGY